MNLVIVNFEKEYTNYVLYYGKRRQFKKYLLMREVFTS